MSTTAQPTTELREVPVSPEPQPIQEKNASTEAELLKRSLLYTGTEEGLAGAGVLAASIALLMADQAKPSSVETQAMDLAQTPAVLVPATEPTPSQVLNNVPQPIASEQPPIQIPPQLITSEQPPVTGTP